MHRPSAPRDVRHPWPVRLTDRLIALAMIGSGWRIYNRSPIFPVALADGVLGGNVAAARC